jgi:ADP-ribose pyrophosphatase
MKKISEQILFQGQWIGIKALTMQNSRGDTFIWESVIRKNNTSSVIIIAKLIPSQRFILIKQFRPAIEGYVLGFPAGLGNISDEQIIEELREETGYTGTIVKKSPVIKPGAGLVNDSSQVIYMQVDEKARVNVSPAQCLECSEEIEVFLLTPSQIKDLVLTSEKQGISISASVWYAFMAYDWIHSG